MIESTIEFKRNGIPHEWKVRHNLDEYKIDIMDAFENWTSRYEQFNIDDFCDYVISKDRINFKCEPID
ncbi:MAG TPA: hypothetical protein VFD46_04490 [Chryseolinea sp.]|nr:hypothetical protein [Chryseolinea sp.]